MLRGSLLPCFLIYFLGSCGWASRCLSLRVTGYATAPAFLSFGLIPVKGGGHSSPIKGKTVFFGLSRVVGQRSTLRRQKAPYALLILFQPVHSPEGKHF
jgi:hypothetical protein